MKKKILTLDLLVVLIAIILTCSCKDAKDSLVEVNETTDQDNLVYAAVMNNMFIASNTKFILEDSTISAFDVTFISKPDDANYFYNNIPDLRRETLEDYLIQNRKRGKISIMPDNRGVFSSQRQSTSKYAYQIYLSRVGYNKEMTQAVVTIGVYMLFYTNPPGYGAMLLLQKSNNQWMVSNKLSVWNT